MATYRVATDDSGKIMLELRRDEYETIKRALSKGLVRAREVGASADEADIVRLLGSLEPAAFSMPKEYLEDR